MQGEFAYLHQIHKSYERTRSYGVRYISEIKHSGLATYRVLKDMDEYRLSQKVEAQFNKWDEQWAKISLKNKTQSQKEASLNIAQERTKEAQEKQEQIEDLLTYALDIDCTVDWDGLKDIQLFKVPNPKNNLENELGKILPPPSPDYQSVRNEPNKADYELRLSLIDKVFKSRKEKKITQTDIAYQEAISTWQNSVVETNDLNAILKQQYEQKLCGSMRQ